MEAFNTIEEDPQNAFAAELGLDMLDLCLQTLEEELSGNRMNEDLVDNAELQVSQCSYIHKLNTYQHPGNRLPNGRPISWLPTALKRLLIPNWMCLRLQQPMIGWKVTMMKHPISSRCQKAENTSFT